MILPIINGEDPMFIGFSQFAVETELSNEKYYASVGSHYVDINSLKAPADYQGKLGRYGRVEAVASDGRIIASTESGIYGNSTMIKAKINPLSGKSTATAFSGLTAK